MQTASRDAGFNVVEDNTNDNITDITDITDILEAIDNAAT